MRGIVQGRGVDSPLNEMGLRQADAFYRFYRHEQFDKIYTSTLQRTHQTVEPFVQAGTAWEQHAGLDEIGWGIYEGKEQTESIMNGFQKLISDWQSGRLSASVVSGESPLELVARQQIALDHILSFPNEKKVLICMHGRAMRILLCVLTGKPLQEMDEFPHTNTSLYVVKYTNAGFEVLDAFNTDHLDDLSPL